MPRVLSVAVLTALIMSAAVPVHAQERPSTPDGVSAAADDARKRILVLERELAALDARKKALDAYVVDLIKSGAIDRNAGRCDRFQEADTRSACNRYNQTWYEVEAGLMRYREETYRRQGWSSWVLLGLVCVVVTAGLFFTYMQLRTALAAGASPPRPRDGMASDQEMAAPGHNTSVEISAQRVQITSSVVGLVVMAMSLVILYLYLVEVYEIRDGGAAARDRQSVDAPVS